jgi:Protein of unknown function (DUF3592)
MSEHNVITLCLLAGYLIAAVFFWAGYLLRSKLHRHLHGAMVTKGKVVENVSSISLSSDSDVRVFHPVFAFRDAQGREHRVRSTSGTFPATHKEGDVVEVFYQPQSPQEAIIDPNGFIQMYRLCFCAAGLITIIITAILMFGR